MPLISEASSYNGMNCLHSAAKRRSKQIQQTVEAGLAEKDDRGGGDGMKLSAAATTLPLLKVTKIA